MMIKTPQELCKKRKAELDLLSELLQREQNRTAGARTFSMDDMRGIAERLLKES